GLPRRQAAAAPVTDGERGSCRDGPRRLLLVALQDDQVGRRPLAGLELGRAVLARSAAADADGVGVGELVEGEVVGDLVALRVDDLPWNLARSPLALAAALSSAAAIAREEHRSANVAASRSVFMVEEPSAWVGFVAGSRSLPGGAGRGFTLRHGFARGGRPGGR